MASAGREIKFQETLKDLLERSRSTVTHKKLGSAIGVSSTTVSHYVNGRIHPSFDALVGIAAFFNVTLDYLVFGERTQSRASQDTQSLRAEVQRALTDSNSYNGRQRDLIVRVNRQLHKEVDRVARSLLDDRENFGPAGFFSDSEAMAIEGCALHTKIMIQNSPADIDLDELGNATPGDYFNTLTDNISAGRTYQYIFYGKRSVYSSYAQIYRELLSRADIPLGIVHENLEFRVMESELPAAVVIHDIDTALLERREPVLWERFRDNGIVNGTLAYTAIRHQDALGGVVLYGGYFESALRMFKRDWEAAKVL
ncbi:MAG TPA: helix-turn-helix transcriptional regulator [Actinocrinis sp.]|nr:helix-turn-helix transcriptional regulator [Actinocrinis sp.]